MRNLIRIDLWKCSLGKISHRYHSNPSKLGFVCFVFGTGWTKKIFPLKYIDGNWTWLAKTKRSKAEWSKTAQVQFFSSAHRIWLGLYMNSTAGGWCSSWSLEIYDQGPKRMGWKWWMWLQNGPRERVENCWCLTIQNHQKKRGEEHYPTSCCFCIQILECFFKLTFYFFAKVKIIIKPPFVRICFELFSKHQTVANLSFVSGGLKVVFFPFTPWKLGKMIQVDSIRDLFILRFAFERVS